jgi:thymidylate synthase (FAD)
MKIIEQYHEILHMDGLDRIERAGRTCYKSEGHIGCLAEGCDHSYRADASVCQNCGSNSTWRFVRMLINRGHEAMIEHGSATVKFITNRGVTHELVRHRVASFGQESTRYVNYGGKEMEFIRPVWHVGDCRVNGIITCDAASHSWNNAVAGAEKSYKDLLQLGWRPEQAREVLPNSLKTEIVVTANYREWRHIFKLRALGTTGKPHPQMQALMLPVLEEFKAKLPALFGDLGA